MRNASWFRKVHTSHEYDYDDEPSTPQNLLLQCSSDKDKLNSQNDDQENDLVRYISSFCSDMDFVSDDDQPAIIEQQSRILATRNVKAVPRAKLPQTPKSMPKRAPVLLHITRRNAEQEAIEYASLQGQGTTKLTRVTGITCAAVAAEQKQIKKEMRMKEDLSTLLQKFNQVTFDRKHTKKVAEQRPTTMFTVKPRLVKKVVPKTTRRPSLIEDSCPEKDALMTLLEQHNKAVRKK